MNCWWIPATAKVRDLRLKGKAAPLWTSDHAAVTTEFLLK